MAAGNNPTETSYQEYKENKLKEEQAKKDHEPSTTDKGTAAKKLKERRKKFKFKLPKVEGLDPDKSDDVASAMAVFAGGTGGSTGDSSGSPSGANLMTVAQAFQDRKNEKEARELAQKKAQIQAERDAKIDALLDKSLA